MRGSGFYHEDVSRPGVSNFLANHETRLTFLNNDNLIVRVAMQRCATTRFGFNQEH